MECVRCVCVWRGGERIGFGHYQSCGNKGSVGRVFWLQWCRGVSMGRLDQVLEGWGGVMSGLSVLMAGPVIIVLCLADTCASEVHPVFNHVAPYGYLFPNMYLFIADIANPYSFV